MKRLILIFLISICFISYSKKDINLTISNFKFSNSGIPRDKKLHASGGFIIMNMSESLGIPEHYCMGLVIGTAISKEIFDYHTEGTPETLDVVYTILGGMIGREFTIYRF